MAVGSLRKTYLADGQFYVNSPIGRIRFYAVAPGAKNFTWRTAFSPMAQVLQQLNFGPGEVTAVKPPEERPKVRSNRKQALHAREFKTMTAPPWFDGQHYHGTLAQHAGRGTDPGLITMAQIPTCVITDWDNRDLDWWSPNRGHGKFGGDVLAATAVELFEETSAQECVIKVSEDGYLQIDDDSFFKACADVEDCVIKVDEDGYLKVSETEFLKACAPEESALKHDETSFVLADDGVPIGV